MQFGSRTLAEWAAAVAVPPAPAARPAPPQTWAARVASGRAGVRAAAHLPAPRAPPSPPSPPSPLLSPSPSPSHSHSHSHSPSPSPSPSHSPSPLPSPSPSLSASISPPPPRTRRRQRPPRAVTSEAATTPLPPRALRGLVNCGNACFTNVVLQALLACDPFRRLLLCCEPLVDATAASLLPRFVRLAREMTAVHSPSPAFTPQPPLLPDWLAHVFPSSVPTPAAAGGSQEDAEEFLSFVLNALHEELVDMQLTADRDAQSDLEHNHASHPHTANGSAPILPNGNSISATNGHVDNPNAGVWEEMTRKGKTVEVRAADFAQSGITDIFGGTLRSEIRRGRAKPSVTREPFFTLSLDIESGLIRDVEHALAAYFEPEQLEGYTMHLGSRGGEETVVDARKQVLLQSVPQVLVLHLKRFSHNSATGALNKVARLMPFPETLDVPAHLLYGGAGRRRYGLTAVVTHLGKDLAQGHYTCDVRWGGPDSDVWVSCDDSKIMRTTMLKVMRKQAYLLFYSLRPQSSSSSSSPSTLSRLATQ